MSSSLLAEENFVDLSIFNNINHDQLCAKKCNNNGDFKNCLSVKRILSTLYYYSSININKNKDAQFEFNKFINSSYKSDDIIMDFFHFKQNHDSQLKEIMEYAYNYIKFKFCKIESCTFSSRLYRCNELDSMINIFDYDDNICSLPLVITLFDSIHHYIFHLGDVGLRDFVNEEEKEKEKEINPYHDNKFSSMKNRILSKQKNTKKFNRLSNGKKFAINIGNHQATDYRLYKNKI